MNAPEWLKNISDHAVITKKELHEWIGVDSADLKLLIVNRGFPPPRFGGLRAKPGNTKLARGSRWRVGDVRAWLENDTRKLARQQALEVGCTQTNPDHFWHANNDNMKRR